MIVLSDRVTKERGLLRACGTAVRRGIQGTERFLGRSGPTERREKRVREGRLPS